MNEISDLMSWLKKSMRFPLSLSLFSPQPPLLLPILRKSWTKKLWQSWKINCKRTNSGKCLDFVIVIGHFDNSMGSLSTTSCTPQNSCYLIWQRNDLINNCNHHSVSRKVNEWFSFFAHRTSSFFIFFTSRRKEIKFVNYDNWSSEKRKKTGMSWTVISKSSCENQQMMLQMVLCCNWATAMPVRVPAAKF